MVLFSKMKCESESLTLLSFLHRVVGVLQKFGNNRLNVISYIPCLGQGGAIADGEGHIQAFSQSLSQQGFTYSGWMWTISRQDEQNLNMKNVKLQYTVKFIHLIIS